MVDKRAHQIRQMFSSVASRYDLLNRLLSLSIDRLWRKRTRRVLRNRLEKDGILLDLCTGTGDLAIELGKIGKVIGLDFCRPMLQVGAQKLNRGASPDPVSFVEGDALCLPFGESLYDAASIAFGLRNLESIEHGLSEFRRVLKPGGQLAILEFSIPTNVLVRPVYLFYFTRILPWIGRIISGKEGPYSYLPASVKEFPHPPQLGQILRKLGYSRVEHFSLSLGIATLTIARRD